MHKPPPQRPTSPDQHIDDEPEKLAIESSTEYDAVTTSGKCSPDLKTSHKTSSLSKLFEPHKG